jgi:SAM-dependent methyltransferase
MISKYSNPVFSQYSYYYDLINQDKDYFKESIYIIDLIKKYNPKAMTILNFGCGTGKHDKYFSESGFNVTGVDLSKEMIAIAKSNNSDQNISYQIGDITRINLNKKFDVITALFHVINYQSSNETLEAFFKNANEHLNSNGILVFDFWYGTAVLNEKPSVRIKKAENNKVKIIRISEPNLITEENVVNVKFEIFIESKTTHIISNIQEFHKMRYLFIPEIKQYLSNINLMPLLINK